MPKHLRREEIVTIQVLNEKGENNCQVARLLGVSEGTVRYPLGRAASGAVDERQNKPLKAEAVMAAIEAWFATDRDTVKRELQDDFSVKVSLLNVSTRRLAMIAPSGYPNYLGATDA